MSQSLSNPESNYPSNDEFANILIDFVAAQKEEKVLNYDQLLAMTTLLGAQAISSALRERDIAGKAEIIYDDELKISQVRLSEDLGHTAVHASAPAEDRTVAQPANVPTVLTDELKAKVAVNGLSSGLDEEERTTTDTPSLVVNPKEATTALAPPRTIVDQPELHLSGLTASEAITRFLQTQQNGIYHKGNARSAGRRMFDELSQYGHTETALSQALRRLAAQNIIALDKKTPTSKMINHIQLLAVTSTESDVVESRPEQQKKVAPVIEGIINEESFKELVKTLPGRGKHTYVTVLKNAGGLLEVDGEHDVLFNRVVSMMNALVPKGDSPLSETDIMKAQKSLHEKGVIELYRADASNERRLTSIAFSQAVLDQIIKNNIHHVKQ